MYRILVAEDELLVRMGICSMIDWKSMDMEICADVADGQSACEAYERLKPDIVITDVRMPLLSGLELIAHIRSTDRHTQIICVTCMDDFDILQQALKLGITDYLVKLTMTQEELRSALFKARAALDAMKPREYVTVPPRIEQHVLLKYYVAGEMDRETFLLSGGEVWLERFSGSLRVGYLFIDNLRNLKTRLRDDFGYRIQITLSDILNQFFNAHIGGMWCNLEDDLFLFVSGTIDAPRLLKVLDTYLEAHCTLWLSDPIEDLSIVPQACVNGLLCARRRRFFAPPGEVLEGDLTEEEFSRQMFEIFSAVPFLSREELPPQEEDVRKHLAKCAAAMLDTSLFDPLVLSTGTLYDIIEIFQRQEVPRQGKKLSGAVRLARDYIISHYDRDIGVVEVAAAVGYTPNHMSARFKQEMGTGITQYLNRLRVQRAKVLLLDENLGSAEVARQIGFAFESYFYKVFKRETGMTPREYREHIQST